MTAEPAPTSPPDGGQVTIVLDRKKVSVPRVAKSAPVLPSSSLSWHIDSIKTRISFSITDTLFSIARCTSRGE